MRSNCADSFSATHLQSGLRTQAALSRKSGTQCAAEKPHQRAPNRTGTVAHDLYAGPVRTTFAHDLCASSISHIAFVHLRLNHLHGRFQCCTREGVRCCTRGGIQCCTREGVQCCTRGGIQCCTREGVQCAPEGVKMAGAPPVCALRAALTPGCNAHHVGQCRPPYGRVAPATMIPAGRLGLRRAETA